MRADSLPIVTLYRSTRCRRSPSFIESRVRFGDTDASGRIFYVSLLHHFDAAEAEFLRSLGVGYREIQDRKTGFPRVRVECDYTGALVYDDLMDIAVTVDRVGRASFTLAFDVSVGRPRRARGKGHHCRASIAKRSGRSRCRRTCGRRCLG